MKSFFNLLIILVALSFENAVASEVDLKLMAGTIAFNPKKVNEEKAVKIAESLSTNPDAQRVFIRQFRDIDMWAVELEWKYEGGKEAFRKLVSTIETSIEEKFGKDIIAKKIHGLFCYVDKKISDMQLAQVSGHFADRRFGCSS